MHLKDEIIKDTNRVEIVQTPLQRLESSRGLQDLLGREKDAIRTQQAARMLELEKKLAEYREKYGVFPGGEKAAREVLLSKKSGANEKISQTVRTILETKATPEEMVPDIMELAMEGKYSCEEASREVVADACEMMLGDSTVVEQLAKENRSLAEKIRDWLREWVENLKIALEGLQADRTESRAMMQYARELQEIWDNALMDAARNNRGAGTTTTKNQARIGTDEESGRPIYQSNFPKGTPKAAKAERILDLIQNVWSKKPIPLVIRNTDGTVRTIKAKFDPTYDEKSGAKSDASKIMGGNRHGSASEQRVTLDLADDYYEIAENSAYNYSKDETGKESSTHQGVKQWHYFVNDILFQEFGENKTTPYRVTINVKERSDGSFVYSFNAEKQKERPSTRRTLHADVRESEKNANPNAQPSNSSIRQSSENSQAENSGKIQNQQRDPRLSDRDVLSLAADMALRQQNKSWTPEDRNRLEIFTVRLRRLEEAQAELKTLKEERKDLLDGRKASEVTKDERLELTQNKNRTDLAKKNVEKREAQLYEIESIEAVKTLLRKSREVVEKETAFKARQRYREKTENRQRYQVLKKRLERTTNEWKRMLLKPTKDRYAPEELVRSCLEVALMLDESGRRLAGFGRNTENEILLPRNIRLVPYRMERVGLTSIRIYAREEIKNETGETADSTLSSVRGMREGTQRSENLRQVSGRNPEEVQREMGRYAGRDGDRGGMPGLREGEGSASLDATGVAENHRGLGTRGGEGEGVKNQQREPRLSDRDVLRRAADLALSDRKMNFTQADRERLKIFKKRLGILDEKQTQRQGYLQAKRDILSNSARLF